MPPAEFESPRSARPEELDAVIETVNYVHRVLKPSTSHIRRDWPHIFCANNVDNLIIVRSDDRVAAAVGIWINDIDVGAVRLRIGGINCLATLPDYRRHGLGLGVMRAAHERMRAAGCHVGLLGTLISNWYRRLGWEYAGQSRGYKFDRGNIGLLPPLPAGVGLRVAGDEALPEVIRLRHADRLGGVRQLEPFREILACRGAPQVVLAEREGRPEAYLLARGFGVREWAGPATLVAALLRAWYEQVDDRSLSTSTRDERFRPVLEDSMSVPAPAAGHGLVGLLDALRIPFSTGYVGLMMLLDPQGIIGAFGVEDVACTEDGDELVLARGGEKCRLSRLLATKLFFGPERVSDFADDVFPLPFWQWSLEHV